MSLTHIDDLPIEIIVEIFKNFSLKKLVLLERVNKLYKQLIRTITWNHFIVKLSNNKSIDYAIKNYRFNKYDCSDSAITDENVKHLSNCHTLNIYRCTKITDESVKHLGNCHKLNLSQCKKITDKSVKHLGNCH